jgi:hypothetical protein
MVGNFIECFFLAKSIIIKSVCMFLLLLAFNSCMNWRSCDAHDLAFLIETGTIPKDWKHANVVPAFKKGERYKAGNYRPISLTCICCKLMEHIITSNIMKHLDSNNILYNLQHGFRKARSCESQLLQFIQELNELGRVLYPVERLM